MISKINSESITDCFAGINIEEYDNLFLVSKPSLGALSTFDSLELVAFHIFLEIPDDIDKIAGVFGEMGLSPDDAAEKTIKFVKRLEKDGWKRKQLPVQTSPLLQTIYFTLTRECDLACPYCYQGLRDRKRKIMPLENCRETLDKIKAFNPKCHLIITGGEPMSHPHFFEILDYIDKLELGFGILCNGTHVDEEAVLRFKKYKTMRRIQFSIDGITEKTHSITRSRSNFKKVMNAIDLVEKHKIPFLLAPTMHEENKHEIYDIAELAISKGGWFSPNNLRTFPHDENDHLFLNNETLFTITKDVNDRLVERFGMDHLKEAKSRLALPPVCSVMEPNNKFICGTGRSLLDIDWNGEVFPCHLLKDRSLILGNIFETDFNEIFQEVENKGIRVPSNKIEKCSSCKFTSNCGGGCRAGAYYSYHSLSREDDLCDVNYSLQLNNSLKAHPAYGIKD